MALCEDETAINCDTCKELSFASCGSINIAPSNLVAGTEYHLFVLDHFNVRRSALVTINGNGSFDVPTGEFPVGSFTANSGVVEMWLSTSVDADYDVPLTFSGTNYNCIVATFTNTTADDCCTQSDDEPCETLCEKIENNTAEAIATCIQSDPVKDAAIQDIICEGGDPVTIRNAETLATITTVESGGTYDVLVFSGIIDNGPPYSNSIVALP